MSMNPNQILRPPPPPATPCPASRGAGPQKYRESLNRVAGGRKIHRVYGCGVFPVFWKGK